MSIRLGAFNKNTGEYTNACDGNKLEEYICPDESCKKLVILKKGAIRIAHFSHFYKTDEEKCLYYSYPTESQIHKDAKLCISKILSGNIPIIFTRKCRSCWKPMDYNFEYKSTPSSVVQEHRFLFNNSIKIADVAYISAISLEIHCIIEIFQTHQTLNQDRPEPWFEIKADTLTLVSGIPLKDIPLKLNCTRIVDCEICEKHNLISKVMQPIERGLCLKCTGNGIYNRKLSDNPRLCINCTCCCSQTKDKQCVRCKSLTLICDQLTILLDLLKNINYIRKKSGLRTLNLYKDFELNNAHTVPALWIKNDLFTNLFLQINSIKDHVF